MTLTKISLTYAKAGGPPEYWDHLKVWDVDCNEFVDNVFEVNTTDGWLMRYLMDGTPERLEGTFEIHRL